MVLNDYNHIASCRCLVSIETEVRTLILAKCLFTRCITMVTNFNLKICQCGATPAPGTITLAPLEWEQ